MVTKKAASMRYNPPREELTLRDYFAAAALTGLAANLTIPEDRDEKYAVFDKLVCDSYDLADNMLEDRQFTEETIHVEPQPL